VAIFSSGNHRVSTGDTTYTGGVGTSQIGIIVLVYSAWAIWADL
jgi:hypothetical protein